MEKSCFPDRRLAHFVRIQACIEARLTDPLLSPRRIAAECGVSVRTLHALFAASGVSFRRYVTGLRLARARALLTDPEHRGLSISDIAFGLGFNSLATFYRAYGRAFGGAPGRQRKLDEAA